MRMNKGKDWDINDNHFPKIQNKRHDPFSEWPDGHCRLIYALSCEEAKKHTSGWAMRNTNNHNVNILKKSCLGVLVCSKRCLQQNGTQVAIRPAICDKARKKQQGKICPNLDCNGILEIQPCRGHCGYPVTHFWRHVQSYGILFQAKGFHDHAKPCTKSTGTSLKRKVTLKRARQVGGAAQSHHDKTTVPKREPAKTATPQSRKSSSFAAAQITVVENNNMHSVSGPHVVFHPHAEPLQDGQQQPQSQQPPDWVRSASSNGGTSYLNHQQQYFQEPNNNTEQDTQCTFKSPSYLPQMSGAATDKYAGIGGGQLSQWEMTNSHHHHHSGIATAAGYDTTDNSTSANLIVSSRNSPMCNKDYGGHGYYPLHSGSSYSLGSQAPPGPPPLTSSPTSASSVPQASSTSEEMEYNPEHWMYCNELQEFPSLVTPTEQLVGPPHDTSHEGSSSGHYASLWPMDSGPVAVSSGHDGPNAYPLGSHHYALDQSVDFSNPSDIFQFEKSFFPPEDAANAATMAQQQQQSPEDTACEAFYTMQTQHHSGNLAAHPHLHSPSSQATMSGSAGFWSKYSLGDDHPATAATATAVTSMGHETTSTTLAPLPPLLPGRQKEDTSNTLGPQQQSHFTNPEANNSTPVF